MEMFEDRGLESGSESGVWSLGSDVTAPAARLRLQTPDSGGRGHEFARQPVEQLRMRRHFDARAEIFRRGHHPDRNTPATSDLPPRASGCWPSTIHRARPRRLRGAPAGKGFNTAGTSGWTISPGRNRSPRLKRCVARGAARGWKTSVVGGYGQLVQTAEICWFNSANKGSARRNAPNNSRC